MKYMETSYAVGAANSPRLFWSMLAVVVALAAGACSGTSTATDAPPSTVTFSTYAEQQAERVEQRGGDTTASTPSAESTASEPSETDRADEPAATATEPSPEPSDPAPAPSPTAPRPAITYSDEEVAEWNDKFPIELSDAGLALGCIDAINLRRWTRSNPNAAIREAAGEMAGVIWRCPPTDAVNEALTCYPEATQALVDVSAEFVGDPDSDNAIPAVIMQDIEASGDVLCASGDFIFAPSIPEAADDTSDTDE